MFEENVLVIDRTLTELDLFVKSFLEILQKHVDYLIVSGFVSISTGRTRGTEDVDVLIPKMDKEQFIPLFNELLENNFWCFQGDTVSEVYPYIAELENVRFARKEELFPNMECIPVTPEKKAQFFEFSHPQHIRIHDFTFKIPPLEFEILYKELVLKSEKDLLDALHLRTVFSEILKQENFKKFKKIIEDGLK